MENSGNVAYCGLYCGACKAFVKGRCPGCHDNEKAAWCKVRSCCVEKNIATCADCDEFENVKDCKKYNNFISKVFGFIFRSDRAACINRIKEIGIEDFAAEMDTKKTVTIKR